MHSPISLMSISFYVLICLSLSLAGVAGLQFFYLAYLERMDKEMKLRIREVECQNIHLKQRLLEAEIRIAEQTKLLNTASENLEDEEIWADVIDDR